MTIHWRIYSGLGTNHRLGRKEDYYLYNKLVYPDDTVNIEFDVWLDLNKDNFNENYNSAKYTIKLTLESSQKNGIKTYNKIL